MAQASNASTVRFDLTSDPEVEAKSAATAVVRAQRRQPPAPNPLSIVPGDESFRIASRLVSRLTVGDARYDGACFGPFLRFLPQRIGANRALDAAVDAFCAALSTIHADTASLQAVAKHGRALATLRACLGDPAYGRASETVCAIYLVMITEGLIGAETGRHGEGMCYILQAQVQRQWTSQFELEMFSVMFFSVLMESIGNKRIKTNPWLPILLDRLEPMELIKKLEAKKEAAAAAGVYPSLFLRSLARMTDLIINPAGRQSEIETMYKSFLDDLSKIRGSLDSMDALATLAGMSLIMNRILQAFEPLDVALIEGETDLVDAIIAMGEEAMPRRPLGAAYARPGLSVAWAAGGDPGRRAVVAGMLSRIRGTSPAGGVWDGMREARWLRAKFAEIDAVILGEPGDGAAPQADCHVQ
ncbi:Fungal Zn(2)-Cys(6) binuclear cluster domain [Geosmithia morbida]|uniref:Fungal Zn(2)-Cys(6) binuclear cluster domain n=1 Tax=Geosmithia morbida TaxID=1094350 RepID=A0A9P4YVB5_9HYPO|nr:Fungal Zn(2)-Cys(6) binuclear cluster domain [Geosmithia morbida]KAF4122710.1 Fungal Zn(2)-Cys(6) binuclear cluster domain [Geosmithia morbida]